MSGFRFEHFGPERKRAKKSETISEEAWRTHNSTILELFSQKLGYEEIRGRITTESFQPSLRQLKAHLKHLGLSRYGPKPPVSNGQTVSNHFSPAPNIAIVSDDQLHFDVAMSEPVAESNATHMNSLSLQDHAASGPNSLIPSTVSAIDDSSDTDTDMSMNSWVSIIDISETMEEANATQIDSNPDSYESCCEMVDLSYAFGTPIQELLRGRQNEYGSRPLRALAKRFMNIATNEGIAVLDCTLAQVIQATQDIFASDEQDEAIVNEGRRKWRICVSRNNIRDYAVVIRVSVHYSERGFHGDSRLALRIRIASPQNFIAESSLTLIVCPGLQCSTMLFDAIEYEGIGEVRSLPDLGEISISCILANARVNNITFIDGGASDELIKLLITQVLVNHAFSSHLAPLIESWDVVTEDLIFNIWRWFLAQWDRNGSGREESFQEQFRQCSEVTSIAQKNGCRIDESDPQLSNILLHALEREVKLPSARRLQLWQYLRQLGLNLETRWLGGKTLLLTSISLRQQNLGIISDFLSPGLNANLYAKDDMGYGYLRIAFGRRGFLTSFNSSPSEKLFDSDYQSRLLALLLSKDETFRERAITPKETPRLTELVFSAVAWDVWASVFEQLNWNMDEMNTYRYKILQRPMLGEFLAPYEEARVQMLGQTRFRLVPDKVEELDREYRNTRIEYR